MCYNPQPMNATPLILIVVAVVLLFVVLNFRSRPVAAATVKEKVAAGAKVVDVRSPMEYQTSHWPGAINIPVGDVAKRLAEFGPTSQPIVVYCHSGNRSGRAQAILQKAGYTDVTNAGGLSDLRQAMQ